MNEDALLRKWGWRIESRPKKGPALWRYGSQIATQEQAVKQTKDFQQLPETALRMNKPQKQS